jgi:hypothetical protein
VIRQVIDLIDFVIITFGNTVFGAGCNLKNKSAEQLTSGIGNVDETLFRSKTEENEFLKII